MGWRARSISVIFLAAIAASLPAALCAEDGFVNRNAFSQPLPALDAEGRDRFFAGNLLFRKLWVAAPSVFPDSDGLGPLFNARSCQSCHFRDGRGRLSGKAEDLGQGLVLRLSRAGKPDPTYGQQLQTMAVPGFLPEGRISVTYRALRIPMRDAPAVLLAEPQYRVSSPAYGILDPATAVSARIAPQLIGLGLLAEIPPPLILANADPEDRDGNGISGKANFVWGAAGQMKLGRFGLKAGSADLRQQTAKALLLDLGLSTDLHPVAWGDCTEAEVACLTAPAGEEPDNAGRREVDSNSLEVLTFYTASLAVPPRRDLDSPLVQKGEIVFAEVGCNICHVPEFRFRSPMRGETTSVRPYTDLLVHDMGPGLADGMPEGLASGEEWRTPPLWGIGLTEAVSGQTRFLHDGRARTLLEAILWHGGEAETARSRVIALPPADRAALIAFLESL